MCLSNSIIFVLYPLKTKHIGDDSIDYIFMVLVSIFLVSFAITLGPISWLYLAEIMTELGMSIAVAVNWLIVILLSYSPNLAFSHKPKSKDHKLFVMSDDTEQEEFKDLRWFFFAFSGC